MAFYWPFLWYDLLMIFKVLLVYTFLGVVSILSFSIFGDLGGLGITFMIFYLAPDFIRDVIG